MFYRFLTLIAFSASITAGQTYTQYNFYYKGNCSGELTHMTSSLKNENDHTAAPNLKCENVPKLQNVNGTQINQTSLMYQSRKVFPLQTPLDLEGIDQPFVVTSIFLGGTCAGNPIEVEAMVADSRCYSRTLGGNITSKYFTATCKDGQPSFKTCEDSECKKGCLEFKNIGACDPLGRRKPFSREMKCVNTGDKYTKTSDGSSTKMTVSAGLGLFLAAAAFQN